jgi:hypothetical protein
MEEKCKPCKCFKSFSEGFELREQIKNVDIPEEVRSELNNLLEIANNNIKLDCGFLGPDFASDLKEAVSRKYKKDEKQNEKYTDALVAMLREIKTFKLTNEFYKENKDKIFKKLEDTFSNNIYNDCRKLETYNNLNTQSIKNATRTRNYENMLKAFENEISECIKKENL